MIISYFQFSNYFQIAPLDGQLILEENVTDSLLSFIKICRLPDLRNIKNDLIAIILGRSKLDSIIGRGIILTRIKEAYAEKPTKDYVLRIFTEAFWPENQAITPRTQLCLVIYFDFTLKQSVSEETVKELLALYQNEECLLDGQVITDVFAEETLRKVLPHWKDAINKISLMLMLDEGLIMILVCIAREEKITAESLAGIEQAKNQCDNHLLKSFLNSVIRVLRSPIRGQTTFCSLCSEVSQAVGKKTHSYGEVQSLNRMDNGMNMVRKLSEMVGATTYFPRVTPGETEKTKFIVERVRLSHKNSEKSKTTAPLLSAVDDHNKLREFIKVCKNKAKGQELTDQLALVILGSSQHAPIGRYEFEQKIKETYAEGPIRTYCLLMFGAFCEGPELVITESTTAECLQRHLKTLVKIPFPEKTVDRLLEMYESGKIIVNGDVVVDVFANVILVEELQKWKKAIQSSFLRRDLDREKTALLVEMARHETIPDETSRSYEKAKKECKSPVLAQLYESFDKSVLKQPLQHKNRLTPLTFLLYSSVGTKTYEYRDWQYEAKHLDTDEIVKILFRVIGATFCSSDESKITVKEIIARVLYLQEQDSKKDERYFWDKEKHSDESYY